ncbi:MAG: hypothetical protein EA343_12095 [Nodularia sp. (in: Bacteria)]|nr:MAG: hypothetical protein EA343_12095 [Nodularia sp. (in: cyanobacteria)]
MAQGDHIYCIARKIGHSIIYHHGIDCGNQTVIHYQKEYKNENLGIIRWVSLNEFAQGKKIYTKKYDLCDQVLIVIARAKRKLGERQYNLFKNNCEHFAHYCKTGKYKSAQVEKAKEVVGEPGIAAANAAVNTFNTGINYVQSTTDQTKKYMDMLIKFGKNNQRNNNLNMLIKFSKNNEDDNDLLELV